MEISERGTGINTPQQKLRLKNLSDLVLVWKPILDLVLVYNTYIKEAEKSLVTMSAHVYKVF